ncbi:MAG: 3-dehydroquinate synthase [Betaproteobacteria bacterium]|nr:3-dehydroquinate synthase [Betaproteobacteria bacterium]
MKTPHPAVELTVALGERGYPIVIGPGLLADTARLIAHLPQQRVALITNVTLWPLFGEALAKRLEASGVAVIPVQLPDGEEFKDWPALNYVFDALLEHSCDRKTTLVALGGGVIGDIAGFAAATYQRGVPYIQIPTTLLAQVDSSVGGKTAINHARGKNMIGAFHQPQLVLADTDVLRSLPEREFAAGVGEIVKYGVGLDADFFAWLETHLDGLLARETVALTEAIRRSCDIKARIVAADERETAAAGGRALLNLGHTFGHAIETALGYGTWLHGEAVGCGMMLAARLSRDLGVLAEDDARRILILLERTGLPVAMPDISGDVMLEHMGRDKKNDAGVIRLILLRGIGRSFVESGVGTERIGAFLAGLPRADATAG